MSGDQVRYLAECPCGSATGCEDCVDANTRNLFPNVPLGPHYQARLAAMKAKPRVPLEALLAALEKDPSLGGLRKTTNLSSDGCADRDADASVSVDTRKRKKPSAGNQPDQAD
jgi:hypothetical protein